MDVGAGVWCLCSTQCGEAWWVLGTGDKLQSGKPRVWRLWLLIRCTTRRPRRQTFESASTPQRSFNTSRSLDCSIGMQCSDGNIQMEMFVVRVCVYNNITGAAVPLCGGRPPTGHQHINNQLPNLRNIHHTDSAPLSQARQGVRLRLQGEVGHCTGGKRGHYRVLQNNWQTLAAYN